MAGREHLDSNEMSDQVYQIRLEVEGQEGLQYWIEDCSAQGTIEANTFLYSISISKSTSNSLSKYINSHICFHIQTNSIPNPSPN